MLDVTPVKVNVSMMVPAMPETSVRRTNVTPLTLPLSGATIDATVPLSPEINCMATLVSVPAITDEASQERPDVNVGVGLPLVE